MSLNQRRTFLQRAASLSSLGAATPLGLSLGAITQAAAQTAGGNYRALVCIFLQGGNDAFNTVLATDSGSWQHYLNHRDPKARNPLDTGTSIALLAPGVAAVSGAGGGDPARLGGVLPISHAGRSVHSGREFALHPALRQLQQLHQDGRVAVLANVGPLTRPTTKADMANARMSKPVKLYSHNDQQSMWQSFKPEGALEGWGGRMGDVLTASALAGQSASSDAALAIKSFTCMSPGSSAVWLASRTLQPYQSSTTSVLSLGSNRTMYGQASLYNAVNSIMGQSATNNVFAADYQKVVQRGVKASSLLGSKLPAIGLGPWSTPGVSNPYVDDKLLCTSPTTGARNFNPLALQLQMVARLIEANRVADTPLTRQFFMVSLGGFDTHDRQIGDQAERLAQLNHAMAYFDTVLGSMPGGNLRSQVTTFTASEFGRTFTSNGDGTDHGWGSHHFIMGGAVRGREVYGSFPQYSTADSQGVFESADQLANGVLLPSTSVDHYAYTLGRWMGVPASELVKSDGSGLLPNLNQFASAGHDLGFMNT